MGSAQGGQLARRTPYLQLRCFSLLVAGSRKASYFFQPLIVNCCSPSPISTRNMAAVQSCTRSQPPGALSSSTSKQ